MALFKKKQPAPAPAVVAKTCVCGVTMEASALADHLDEHIVEVVMPGGHMGRSYVCPLCGPSDEVYGQPGEHPISLRNMSRALFERHCRDVHGVDV